MVATSIQEIRRKINSYLEESIPFIDVLTIILTMLILGVGFIWITYTDIEKAGEVVYTESTNSKTASYSSKYLMDNTYSIIVASKNGKTYFYSWCKGVEKIKEQNKIIFENEQEAQVSGRVLAKTCNRINPHTAS